MPSSHHLQSWLQADLTEDHGVKLLERAVAPKILKQMYLSDTWETTMDASIKEMWRIGWALELYQLQNKDFAEFTWSSGSL